MFDLLFTKMAIGKVEITDVACICGSPYISMGQCYSGWKMAKGRKCLLVLHKQAPEVSLHRWYLVRKNTKDQTEWKSEVNIIGSADNRVHGRYCQYLGRVPSALIIPQPWLLPAENLTRSPGSCLIAGMSSARSMEDGVSWALFSLRTPFSQDEWKLMDMCHCFFAPRGDYTEAGSAPSPRGGPHTEFQLLHSHTFFSLSSHRLLYRWFLGSFPKQTPFVGSAFREIEFKTEYVYDTYVSGYRSSQSPK